MKRWACSDLHGRYNLWKQIRDYCADDDIIYFLGDAIDRGDNGIKIMLEMIDDERICYIKGNHEDMMYNSIEYPDNKFNWLLWDQNDNFYTWINYYNLSKEEQNKIVHFLVDMPYYAIVPDKDNKKIIILNHSGNFVPDNKTIMLWDRKHIENNNWSLKENYYIVHGHTPVQYLRKYNIDYKLLNQEDSNICAVSYCGGHKIDIDLGCYRSGAAALLDLDTFEVKYFYDRPEVIKA